MIFKSEHIENYCLVRVVGDMGQNLVWQKKKKKRKKRKEKKVKILVKIKHTVDS